MIHKPSLKRIYYTLFVFFFVFLFWGVTQNVIASVNDQKGNTPVVGEKPRSDVEASVKKEFSYSPIGKRDPFEPLIEKFKPPGTKPEKEKGPLEKFDLGQFRLTAMMLVKGTPRAMVKAPDGKSYIVKPGDKIGKLDGEIVKIETKVIDPKTRAVVSPDRIVIKENGFDPYTNKEVVEFRYITM